MLIGLLSDTHIGFPSKSLPTQIRNAFRGVDLILHAGDIWVPSVLDELEAIAPVVAAWGDDDMEVDLGHDKRMIKERTLILDGANFWLTHIKPPYGVINPKEAAYPPWRTSENPSDPPDVIVFGHTHVAAIEHYKGTLLVNPGSVTFPNDLLGLGTVALLTVSSGRAEAQIIRLEGEFS